MIIGRTGGTRGRTGLRGALLLGCAALALLPTAGASAQEDGAAASAGSEAEAEEAVVLEPVILRARDDDAASIVAARTTAGSKMPTDILDTPASVSVITAKELQQRGASSVEEAIQYSAGVLTDFYGADDRFDFFKIRGFDAHLFRDGMTLGDPFGGIREETYAFERVEVLKGANSTVFGVSDPGGSVNFVTKTPKRERFGEIYATGGSFEHKEIGFDFGDNITADDTLSFRLTGKLKDADKEYDYSRDDEKFIMGGLTWRPTEATSLTVVFDHLDRDGVPGSGGYPVGTDFDRDAFFGEPDYNFQDTNRDTITAMFDHDFGSGLSLNASARYSSADTGFGYAYISATPTDGSTVASRAFYENAVTTDRFISDAHLAYDTRFGDVGSRTLVGVEYGTLSSGSETWWGAAPGIDWTNPVYTGAPSSVPKIADQSVDTDTVALYLQQEVTLFDRLIATAGLRNDWIETTQTNRLSDVTTSGDFSEFTGRFALTYKITDEVSAWASYAESVVPGSSLSVDPERGEQYEIGLKYRPEAFPGMFSVALYDLTKNNITRTNPATMLQEAIGEVRVRGVDVEAKAEITDAISLTAAYSYMESKIVENGTAGNEGNEMSFVPNHIASLWLNYLWEGEGNRGDMTFGVGARYQGSYFFNDANTISTGDSVVFDAALQYAVTEQTSLQVNVSNIFDEKHVAYGGFGADFYNPGRAISATLRHTW